MNDQPRWAYHEQTAWHQTTQDRHDVEERIR